jgi:hypothetical protein
MRTYSLLFAWFLVLSLACGSENPPPAPSVEGGAGEAGTAPEDNISDEQEPNNSLKQPQSLAFGKKVRGTLGPVSKGKGDEDWFVIDAGATRKRVKVELSGVPEIDLALALFDDANNRLASINNHGAGDGERAPVLGLTPGKNYLRVKEADRKKSDKGKPPASNETSPYILSIEELPDAPDEELEPNEKKVDATPLSPGQEMHGYLAWKGDADWYKIPTAGVEAGSTMRVDFKGVEGVVLTVAIYDSIEENVFEVKPLKPQEPQSWRNIGVQTGPGFEAYYIAIIAKDKFQEEERYSLAVSFEKGTGDSEIESNNELKKATPISNGQRLSGAITQNDVDFFKVIADTPAIMRVDLDGVENLDLSLEIQNAAGKRQVLVNEGKKKEGEVVPNIAVPLGETFIKVSAGKGEFNDLASYALGVNLEPQDGTAEVEPNNESARATEIALGLTLTGFYFPKGDVDIYRLDLSNRTEAVQVDITVSGIPKADLELALLNAAKVSLQKATKRPAGEPESIEATLDPGVYEIEVRGKSSNPRDRYQITVEER